MENTCTTTANYSENVINLILNHMVIKLEYYVTMMFIHTQNSTVQYCIVMYITIEYSIKS